MKTDFKARAVSFIASLTLAVLTTLGIAVSMTSSGDQAWTEASAQLSSSAVARNDAKSSTQSAAKPGAQVMSAWTAPVATTARQVM